MMCACGEYLIPSPVPLPEGEEPVNVTVFLGERSRRATVPLHCFQGSSGSVTLAMTAPVLSRYDNFASVALTSTTP